MLHIIARADGQTGRRQQKLDDVQDFIKIQEAKKKQKKQFIGSDEWTVYVLSPFPEYLSHKVWFNNCAAVCSVFFIRIILNKCHMFFNMSL